MWYQSYEAVDAPSWICVDFGVIIVTLPYLVWKEKKHQKVIMC